MRILIVDDHVAVRRSLAQALQHEPGIEVVGEAADGSAAVRLAGQLKPNVVLMDVVMPRINGIEATRQIARDYPEIRIIGLSVYDCTSYATRMLEAGACAYLLKDCNMEDLTRAILGGAPASRHSRAPAGPRAQVPVGAR